jgi:hypothetical protein
MTGVVLSWKQTLDENIANENLPTQVLELLEQLDLTYVEGQGGINMELLLTQGSGALAVEDFVLVEGDISIPNLTRLRHELGKLLSRPATLHIETEGKPGTDIA